GGPGTRTKKTTYGRGARRQPRRQRRSGGPDRNVAFWHDLHLRDRLAAQGQDAERPRRDRRDPAGGEIDRRVRDEARARSALAGGRMTIIIAGTVRVPPENIPLFRPHMQTMLSASRAEDGCITYSYAVDVADPG